MYQKFSRNLKFAINQFEAIQTSLKSFISQLEGCLLCCCPNLAVALPAPQEAVLPAGLVDQQLKVDAVGLVGVFIVQSLLTRSEGNTSLSDHHWGGDSPYFHGLLVDGDQSIVRRSEAVAVVALTDDVEGCELVKVEIQFSDHDILLGHVVFRNSQHS